MSKAHRGGGTWPIKLIREGYRKGMGNCEFRSLPKKVEYGRAALAAPDPLGEAVERVGGALGSPGLGPGLNPIRKADSALILAENERARALSDEEQARDAAQQARSP